MKFKVNEHLQKLLVFVLLISILISPKAFSKVGNDILQSQISLEFGIVPGATNYEIELYRLSNNKKYNFKIKSNVWKALLPVGKYKFHLRAYDHRSVPGEWSPMTEVEVVLPAPILLSPANNQVFHAIEANKSKIRLKWKEVKGASSYEVRIEPLGKTLSTSGSELDLEVPTGEIYSWTVTAVDSNKKLGNKSESFSFKQFAKKLIKPQFVEIQTRYVQEVEWSEVPYAETYNYQLQQKTENGKWRLIEKYDKFDKTKFPFSLKFPGGEYRVLLFAEGKMRENSDSSEYIFNVNDGDRSPEGYEKALLLESLNKDKSWYAIASYFLTIVDYTSTNAETNAQTQFYGIGGTGRIGVGYSPPENRYGGFAILDMSGYNSPYGILTYPSLEIHGLFTKRFEISQLRATWGLFVKDLPDSVAGASGAVSQDKVTFLGLHGGVEYWYPFNRLFGAQVNLRYYESLVGLHTSNGESLQPGLYTQYGFLGSYRFRKDLMGMAGYALRSEEVKYKSRLGGASLAKGGDVNTVSIAGHYFNVVVEYEF